MKAFSGKQTKLALAFAALAMTASMGAQAVAMTPTSITGPYSVYLETAPGSNVLQQVLSPTFPDAENALDDPGKDGNVELGKFGNPVNPLLPNTAGAPYTLLNGYFTAPADIVVLSSLTYDDWTANSNWLTKQYITDAAASITPTPLTASQLNDATAKFLTFDIAPGAAVLYPWQGVSDPNISDVNLIGGSVVVGLDGLLDASIFLGALFNAALVAANEPPVPTGVQASEVVKVTYDGNTKYLYGFSATPTGYATQDGSYSGRYTVPIPATLWLMGIGLAALVAGRRR